MKKKKKINVLFLCNPYYYGYGNCIDQMFKTPSESFFNFKNIYKTITLPFFSFHFFPNIYLKRR